MTKVYAFSFPPPKTEPPETWVKRDDQVFPIPKLNPLNLVKRDDQGICFGFLSPKTEPSEPGQKR